MEGTRNINNSHQDRKKKSSENLFLWAIWERRKAKEEGRWSSVTKQCKLKHFPSEKTLAWKINWFQVHKCLVEAWCSSKWKNFFSSKISIFARKKCFHGNFFEDTVPATLTTGMLKSLITMCFEQANGGEWWKYQKQHYLQDMGSLDENDLEWLWVNVLRDRAGAVLAGGVCTLPTLPTAKWADQHLKHLPAMHRWEGGICWSISPEPMCAGVVRLPTFK